jgi:hypothetical protein
MPLTASGKRAAGPPATCNVLRGKHSMSIINPRTAGEPRLIQVRSDGQMTIPVRPPGRSQRRTTVPSSRTSIPEVRQPRAGWLAPMTMEADAMGRNCSICVSPERDSIDVELAGGESRRAIATGSRRSESAVRRHAAAHLEPGLHRVALGRESLRFGGLLDRLVQLSEVADDVLAEAVGADGDRRLALAAIREGRELINVISRLTGADSAEAVMDAERLARALARVLPLLPGGRRRPGRRPAARRLR